MRQHNDAPALPAGLPAGAAYLASEGTAKDREALLAMDYRVLRADRPRAVHELRAERAAGVHGRAVAQPCSAWTAGTHASFNESSFA